jgi:hypothetical protein
MLLLTMLVMPQVMLLQVTRSVTVAVDSVRPIITLIGNSLMLQLAEHLLIRATAADNVDGNISSRIVVAGDAVNVNVAGTYIITYNVKDAASNAATSHENCCRYCSRWCWRRR